MSSLQSEIERRGEQFSIWSIGTPESLFSKAGFYQRMMAISMRDENFKVQMFRFVDVLASLRRSGEIVRHLDEYFADMRNGYAPLIRTGVQLAEVVPWISGQDLALERFRDGAAIHRRKKPARRHENVAQAPRTKRSASPSIFSAKRS